MAHVAVLTDSTASLPPELLAAGLRVRSVPLRVVIGDEEYPDDGVGLTRHDLATRLRDGGEATTSQPSALLLGETMRTMIADGADALVALHLSGELSGTVDQARLAAADVTAMTGVPVRVVDTRTTAGGLGLAVVAAAEVAAGGARVEQVVAVAREVAARSRVLFIVPDLHHLARGGRIGAARAVLGSALGVRPILTIEAGRIVVAELVRGAVRARRRIVELAVRAAGGPGVAAPRGDGALVRVVVHHFDAVDQATELSAELTERLAQTGAQLEQLVISEVSAVVGAHTGPGVIGVAIAPAPH